ncbi:ferredoxin-NADP(+) reductase subunit alpha [Clostridium pasteurianum DSM 525 = ATCC 6013]|uniref:Dihydroorotate dehydrogenase n=1 Tax=Clostridium pasteurianum DSM 525 = ATCC 6013 TaxID=1262449 RepID=A0A0H3J632_CLOPA|nr:sulfide/dihydroorotate dehydrogenase-like FAD/NAD-binding protein [Clostridium pasteurianum]AJA48924.1 ferredoxin-NADP(+) reductase subunit alpha [Clostridium pasteurianum DSM 525 = ATCC 6013]AJA52912.1 ferredoxin-NADP(+) reductase subunit alpha [Clostridium pasteurianum DSM 525 = ATCC 6013]AOZ76133.1 NAD-binding oxidoreductase [Clostridium pasteurianum DSM 525 = ATCC 6013]AOZ79929.1 NAD-binding oxidoreductase [Clostridium pasteurianum]ELP60220.1 ferredoxin-NADP(+) reductase subunit alpha [
MFKILDVSKDVNDIYSMKIMAPRVAKSIKPGQFIILRIDEKGERIPFSICDYNIEEQSITIIFKNSEEASVKQLSNLKIGDSILDLAGPIGQASFFVHENVDDLKEKNILFVTDELSAARVYPALSWLYKNNVASDVLVAFNSYKNIIFEDKIEDIAKNLIISTEDGSKGIKGTISTVLKNILDEDKKYDLIISIGSTEFMEKVCSVTKDYGIKTIVSLTTLMLDGIGMCGGCRLTIAGNIKFACQDGPEFDGHLVDFEEVKRRENFYSSYEAKLQYRKEHGVCNHSENEVTIGVEEDIHE